jgi:Rho GTPase-activating protein 1
MDAHNLAIVLCPNLVSGSSPAKDIAICSLPGGPTLHPELSNTSTPPPQGRATLGTIIKLCIQRYYEIFDEVQDRSEARPPARSFAEDDVASSDSSNRRAIFGNSTNRVSVLSRGSSNRDSRGFDDDESIDDTMLVMSVDSASGAPPSAWGSTAGPGVARARPRSELTGSGGSQGFSSSRSMHALNHSAGATGAGQVYRARSTISNEKAGGPIRSKGTLSIGRGTVRKASGAGVEAIGVTASGFFAPPPLPSGEGEAG